MKNGSLLTAGQAVQLIDKHLAGMGIPKTISLAQLQMRRMRGTGPKYIKFGHYVYYDQKSLIEWINNNIRHEDA